MQIYSSLSECMFGPEEEVNAQLTEKAQNALTEPR